MDRANKEGQFPSSLMKTAKSRAKPTAAKRAKSLKSIKSTVPRKLKVKAAQPPSVVEDTAGETDRFIKRKSPAGERNKMIEFVHSGSHITSFVRYAIGIPAVRGQASRR
jgi:hypothetical protein